MWFAAAILASGAFPVLAAGVADAPPGATSCSGCHPAKKWVDTRVPRLNGRPAGEIISAMQAFKAGEASGTVMDRIAKGFSSEEIKAIADWYAAQKD
jgi:sulfide dehydrogenase cytochrome subunit